MTAIGVHCAAGLGRLAFFSHCKFTCACCGIFLVLFLFFRFLTFLNRAPVLVAVALLEYGLDALKAVELIREKRRLDSLLFCFVFLFFLLAPSFPYHFSLISFFPPLFFLLEEQLTKDNFTTSENMSLATVLVSFHNPFPLPSLFAPFENMATVLLPPLFPSSLEQFL